MIISQALKLQGDFNRTVKICNHSFGDEKVSCAYKKKQYSYYNYLPIKMRFGKWLQKSCIKRTFRICNKILRSHKKHNLQLTTGFIAKILTI